MNNEAKSAWHPHLTKAPSQLLTPTQLLRQYQEFCLYHANPPSFEEWRGMKEHT